MDDGGGRLVLADPRYEALNGMLGGWTAATLLRAGLESAGGSLVPAAITVNFVDRVEAGRQVAIAGRRLGGGRSLHHWGLDAVDPEDGRVLARALLVLASRRDTDGHTQPAMPEAPAPELLTEVRAPIGTFGERLQIRPVTVFAAATEIGEVGEDYVLVEAVGTRGADARSGQQAHLWSRSGALLATSEQLCWYR